MSAQSAAIEVLKEAGKPLHVIEIAEWVRKGGASETIGEHDGKE